MSDRKLLVLENGRITSRGLAFVDGKHQLFMDEDDVLDVTIDWSRWLGSDTISTSTFTSDGGANIASSSSTSTTASANLSGEDGTSLIENKIVTANGLTKALKFYTRNKERSVSDYPTFRHP